MFAHNIGEHVPEDPPVRPAPVDVLPAVQTRALHNGCDLEAELFTFRLFISAYPMGKLMH